MSLLQNQSGQLSSCRVPSFTVSPPDLPQCFYVCVFCVCVCVPKVPRRPSSQHGATLSAALQEGLHHDALQRLDAMSNYM